MNRSIPFNENPIPDVGKPDHHEDNRNKRSSKSNVHSAWVSALDVMNLRFPSEMFLLDKLIPFGNISMLCGPSEAGKSTLARQIAMAVVFGKSKVLGIDLHVRHRRCLYISTEDRERDWNQFLSQLRLPEEEKELLQNLTLCCRLGKLTSKSISNQLQEHPVDLIVVDVLSDILKQDSNSTTHVRQFFEPFKDLAAEQDCSILFTHHLSKSGQKNINPDKLNVLGSQGFESSVRSLMEIRKDTKNPAVSILSVTKANYLSPDEKSVRYKFLQQEDRTFIEFNKSVEIQLHSKQPDLAKRVLELHAEGLTTRAIADRMLEANMTIGKSKVAEIIKEAEKLQSLQNNQSVTPPDSDSEARAA